jgi:S1-C subfamily serine protease
MVKTVVESARGGGTSVRRPWFGARMQAVSADMAEALGLDRPTGALVVSVVKGSPAAEAGLKSSDVILSIDGQNVDDPDSFGYRMATKHLGGTASLGILRGGKRLVVPVKLEAAPEVPPRDTLVLKGRNPLAGATVVNLSPAVAEEMSLDASEQGVAITDIADDSFAQRYGFQKGDVLLEINGVKLVSTKRLENLVKERFQGWRLKIDRGGQVIQTVLNG